MASNRSRAKAELIPASSEATEPEGLQEAFEQSHAQQKETNRSKEALRKLEITASEGERGIVGNLIGGKENSPSASAFIAMLAGIVGALLCFICAALSSTPLTWITAGETFLAFAGSALAYIFGRGNRK